MTKNLADDMLQYSSFNQTRAGFASKLNINKGSHPIFV